MVFSHVLDIYIYIYIPTLLFLFLVSRFWHDLVALFHLRTRSMRSRGLIVFHLRVFKTVVHGVRVVLRPLVQAYTLLRRRLTCFPVTHTDNPLQAGKS